MYLYKRLNVKFSERNEDFSNNSIAIENLVSLLDLYSINQTDVVIIKYDEIYFSALFALHDADEKDAANLMNIVRGSISCEDNSNMFKISLDKIDETYFAAEALTWYFDAPVDKKSEMYCQITKTKNCWDELSDTIKNLLDVIEDDIEDDTGGTDYDDDEDEEDSYEEESTDNHDSSYDDCETDDYDDENNDESFIINIMNNIEKLTGMGEFKAYIEELEALRPIISQWNLMNDFPSQHLLFSIDSGNGCSTALGYMHRYLQYSDMHYASDYLFQDNYGYAELKFSYNSEANIDMDNIVGDMKNTIDENSPGLIGIHIDDWIDKLYSNYFSELLKHCLKKRHKNTYVFIMPYLDEEIIEKVNRRLNDILNVRVIRFKPYTDEELLQTAKDELARFNIKWDQSADKFFLHALNEERSDYRFYGIKTVKKLATELVLLKAKNAALKCNECPEDVLTGEDFRELINDDGYLSDISGYDQLEAMIGIDKIKKTVKEMVVSLKAQKLIGENGAPDERPCYHMMFTGNPGTGKTAVARIIGRIFKENGLLPVGDLIETTRFSLVGEYIGQTGPKTIAACRSAMGSVMFIDEAYLLAGGSGSDNRDYGPEAIGALISQMENNRDKFVVIMAGYKDEMDKLCETNAGLRDRLPFKIHFENYTREELYEIFKLYITKKYEVEEKLLTDAKGYFMALPDEVIKAKEFGNARFVRNIAERVKMKALIRMYGRSLKDIGKIKLLAVDFECAVLDKDIKKLNEKDKCTKIGFIR